MYFLLGLVAAVVLLVLYEYRQRKPDQIILYESNGKILKRRSRYYPRHFSLAISGTTYSFSAVVNSVAKGGLDTIVNIIASVSVSLNNLSALIRVGSWKQDALTNAAKEFEILLQGLIRGFTEKYEIEELSSEKLSAYLKNKIDEIPVKYGIEVVALSIQSIDPVDKEIADAMKKKEAARILELTETANQNARVTAAKVKIKADEEINASLYQLELKKIELKKLQEEKEAEISKFRIEEELSRRKMQLEIDKEEMKILKDNPELILLTPQVARLAEASQSLKNARTIVSLSQNEIEQGTGLLGTIQSYLQQVLSATKSQGKKNDSQTNQ